ncbi:hypothetical protein LNKW23_00410 [Paralimibaculum aggregatum]|uniref:ATP-grasp domain-containing protein n=1 Tax=Paralimibaculum aggregatum TaxID=3036245 RepID=A0ABQ6LFM0_9RHOB|nr:ATP-grasp domain-containing protein [Limibaculum sp. NKW23]GMG80829.1 hypothetical protein LNKW23_00410 [Limibaculum sp. NKW23]
MSGPETRPLLVILSNEIQPADAPGRYSAPYSVRSLMKAADRAGFEVAAGPVWSFQLRLPSDGRPARLMAMGRVYEPAAMIVRATGGGSTHMVRAIDHALRRNGCVMLDPNERFQRGSTDLSDLIVEAQGSGADVDRTLVASRVDLAACLRAHDYSRGKLVAKSIAGSGGVSVRWVDGSAESIRAVLDVAESFGRQMPPFLIEPALDIAAEYRVYTLDGAVIGCVRRVAAGPERPANASQGAELVEEPAPADVLDALGKVMRQGLIGWDVARLADGRTVVIEMNRPPSWRHFAKVSKTDIAELVVAHLKARLAAAQAG